MKLKKILKVILIVILSLGVLLVVLANASFKLPVMDYYRIAKGEFTIPDINSGFIPQGLSYDKDTDVLYATGYAKEGMASPVYIIDQNTGKTINKVFMAEPDGSAFEGHCGGISIYHNKLYVAGGFDQCLYVFDEAAVKNAEYEAYVPYEAVVALNTAEDGVGIAFTAVYDDTLYAGEFYRDPNYPTNESHYVNSKDGVNKAIAVAIALEETNETTENGVPVIKGNPTLAISLPDQVQGMYIDDENIYLSTSYGTKFSHILKYHNVVKQGITGSAFSEGMNSAITVLDKEIPLYVLDSTVLVTDRKIAPMSEEIDVVDGKMYVFCESASNKYIFGKLLGAQKCYAIDLSAF